MPVTWEDFDYVNKNRKKDAFEQLSHYLFLHRHGISTRDVTRYENQPGVEIEPIPIKAKIDSQEKVASYQAKHFGNVIRWQECKASIEVTVKRKCEGITNYASLEHIDFYLNRDGGQTNQARNKIEEIANDAGIAIHWHYGWEILQELNNPSADSFQKNIIREFFDVPNSLIPYARIPTIDTPLTKVVGRDDILPKIKEGLAENRCIQLYGFPGIGKSTLACHVATSEKAVLGAAVIEARDLSGTRGGESVEQQVQLLAVRAVSKFVTGQVEGDVLEIAKELFRSDSRLLVIDNLEAPELIRNFIATVRPARLILTSRRQTPEDLAGGVSIEVGELSPDASKEQFHNDSELLESLENANPVEEICSLLGYLPLAINLLAVQLRRGYFENNPDAALEALRQKRLDFLDRYGGDSLSPEDNLRLSFELSYERLGEKQKCVFRTMGVLMPTGANLASIAYMSGLQELDVRYALEELVQRSLVRLSDEKTYSLHTLLWEYAREKVDAEPTEEIFRERVLRLIQELLEGYDNETRSVNLELYKSYWKQAAYLTLRANPELVNFAELSDATSEYLIQTSQYWEAFNHMDWMLTQMEMWENHHGEAVCLDKLGNIYQYLGYYQEALDAHKEALKVARKHNLRDMEGITLGNLGNGYNYVGEHEKALECHKKSAEIAIEGGNKRVEGAAIGNQAIALRALGKSEEAYEFSVISLFLARAIGHRKGELPALASYANAVASLFGDIAARKFYEEALDIAGELENRSMQASLLRNVGRIEQGLGNYGEALECFDRSFTIADELSDTLKMIQALGSMGEVSLSLGNPEKAVERHDAALAAAREIGNAEQEGVQLDCLGSSYQALGQLEKALSCHTKALAIFESINYRRGISAATGNMGRIYHYEGDYQNAFKHYFSSLETSMENQHWEGVGLSLSDLGDIFAELNDFQFAATFWIAACPILERVVKAHLDAVSEKLRDLRKKWEEFDVFVENLINGKGENIAQELREIGLLEDLSKKYLYQLTETN